MMQKYLKMIETLANGYSSVTEYSANAIQWIPTWQGLDGFQKSLRPSALDECSLSIGRVKPINAWSAQKQPDELDAILQP